MRLLITTFLCAASLFAAGELSGRRAPSFSLPDATGRQYDILDFRGKLLLVDFMRTNCPHCASMTERLEEVKQKFGDKVAVLSVLNFPEDNPQSAGQYSRDNRMKTPMLFDCGSVAVSYLKATSFSTPHVFLVDAKGMIRNDFEYGAMTQGMFEGKELLNEVDRLLRTDAAPAVKKK